MYFVLLPIAMFCVKIVRRIIAPDRWLGIENRKANSTKFSNIVKIELPKY